VARSRPTSEKRAKERARQEKRKIKDERRASAKAQRASSPRPQGGEDPDIAGIRPGPQPSPWGDDAFGDLGTADEAEDEAQ
jgi:hypothetical protein